jgi:hypothetical protein
MFSFNIIVHYDNDKTNLIGTIFRSFIGALTMQDGHCA